MSLIHLQKLHVITLLSVFPPQVSWHPIGPALLYCWHIVDNVDPTVNQHWAGDSRLLGGEVFSTLCCSILSSIIVAAVKSPFLRMGYIIGGIFG